MLQKAKILLRVQSCLGITRNCLSTTNLTRPLHHVARAQIAAGVSRTFSTNNSAPSKADRIVSKLAEAAEEQARSGEGFDANVNDPTGLLESMSEEEKSEFVLDPHRVEEIHAYAKEHWRRFLKLPAGWHSFWENWELLHTFYYPTPYYFLLIPQIDVIVNIRHALPGEARPLMYNNELEAFFFEIVERNLQQPALTDVSRTEKPRLIYFLDWKAEELYLVENASTSKEISAKIVNAGGLGGLRMKRIEPNLEGENVIDRLLEEDDTVIPELIDKYLGYSPAPTGDLLERLLDEADEVAGEEAEELEALEQEEVGPELKKESMEAYEEMMKMLRSDVEDPEELEQAGELLENMKNLTPEEMKPLRDLLVLLRQTDPSDFEDVKESFAEKITALEREIEEDGKELAELLVKTKLAKKR